MGDPLVMLHEESGPVVATFAAAVISALEKKVTYRADAKGDVSNLELAML